MAQLVEQPLLIPEVCVSTPVVGKIYIDHLYVYLFIINCIEKTKINKKRPGMAHFFKKKLFAKGCGGVKMVGMLAFYFDDPSSNPFCFVHCLNRTKIINGPFL